MIRLENYPSPFEQHRIGYIKRVGAALEFREFVAKLVLEEVHPANLGALPPSPDVLMGKALMIGLIGSMNEVRIPTF